MPDAARRYVRLTENLSKVLGWFAVAMICASILLVVQMVVYRYALGLSTSWQTEVIIFLIVAATFIGSPYVLQQRGHINVDILATLLNERGRRRLELLGGVLSLLFCVAMAYYSALWWYDTLERGRTTPTMARIPLWIPCLSLPLGMLTLSLQYVANLLELFFGGREPEYAEPAAVAAVKVSSEPGGRS